MPEKLTPGQFLKDWLTPYSPSEGPPLPKSFGLEWPGFIGRSIQRIITEGPLAPYKRIKDQGLKSEFKREIELVTGRKYE